MNQPDVAEHSGPRGALEVAADGAAFLFESNPVPMWIFDAESLQVLSVNRAALDAYGYTEEEFLGRGMVEICSEEDRARFLEGMSGARKGHRDWGQWCHSGKDGGVLEVELATHPVRFDGREALFAAVHDITEHKQAEREHKRVELQLLQAQKMEAIGQLAGGVAHDFNNLLAVIVNYARFVKDELGSDHPAADDVEEIRLAGERGAKLVRQLLAFSRKEIISPEVLNLNELVADAEKLLRRTIGENIDLRITVAEDLRCTEMDRGQIEQILMNLVVNARDAMPQGGKVVIQTSNESIDEERARTEPGMVAGEYVCISVTDSGEGMTKEVQSHVFEPFFTTKPRGKGTGLGLATIYGIVKRAGGYVSVYSEPGWGATFRVYLPVSQAQPTLPAREAEPDATKGGGETVLVVEDEEAVRNLVNRILTRSGYRVLQAASGQEAIELLEKEGPIELLLTDVIMPDMSGKELAQRLPAGSEGFKTLYMSGYTDEIVAREGILEAGVAFIQKPFNAGDLAKRVRQVLTV